MASNMKRTKVLGAAAMLLCIAPVAARSAEANPSSAPASAAAPETNGTPKSFVDAPKLLAPLPPPPPDAAPPSRDPRDLHGVWLAQPLMLAVDSLANLDARNPFPGPLGVDPAKLTKKALEKQRFAEEMNRKGTPLASDAARCRPMNDIGVGGYAFPGEIVQTSRMIVLLQEEGRTRWIIHLDRGHPQGGPRSFWGDSVGHWEGDTLVVDTIGFDGKAQDTTETTHVTSRLRKLDDGQKLELTVTVEDPQTYLEPVSRTSIATWHPELQMLEFQCEENPTGAMEGLTAK
jgi:hypothetical protein